MDTQIRVDVNSGVVLGPVRSKKPTHTKSITNFRQRVAFCENIHHQQVPRVQIRQGNDCSLFLVAQHLHPLPRILQEAKPGEVALRTVLPAEGGAGT